MEKFILLIFTINWFSIIKEWWKKIFLNCNGIVKKWKIINIIFGNLKVVITFTTQSILTVPISNWFIILLTLKDHWFFSNYLIWFRILLAPSRSPIFSNYLIWSIHQRKFRFPQIEQFRLVLNEDLFGFILMIFSEF